MTSEAPVSSPALNYLVTGMPCLLARRIVEKLLGELEPHQGARVRVLDGDPVAIDWGLSGAEYVELVGTVNRAHFVVHPRDLVGREPAEHRGALLGREIVEFVRTSKQLDSAVVYSSLAVSGDRTGRVRETELVRGQSFKRGPDQCLAMMELMVRRQLNQLPFVVVRPARLAGDSQTGEFDDDTPMGRLLEAIMRLNPKQAVRVIRARTPAYLVATDFVARVAYYLGRLEQARGKSFQLTEGHPRSLQNLVRLLLDRSGHEGERIDASVDPRLGVTQAQLTRASQDVGSPNVFYDTALADA